MYVKWLMNFITYAHSVGLIAQLCSSVFTGCRHKAIDTFVGVCSLGRIVTHLHIKQQVILSLNPNIFMYKFEYEAERDASDPYTADTLYGADVWPLKPEC